VSDDHPTASSYGWRAISFAAASEQMHHVYLLQSQTNASQTYIGLTDDLRARLKNHNEGGSHHTAKCRPWEIVCYIAFSNRQRAVDFERYLKGGSGHAFARRHLW